MWAMIPMLRVWLRGNSRIAGPPPFTSLSGGLCCCCCFSAASAMTSFIHLLPAVVRERLVRFGHLVHVLAALDRGPGATGCVEDLAGQTIGHAAFATLAGERHQPPDGKRGPALGL